ncbi:MAG: DUF5615 family PIN-like protein [Phycisphaerales bacterium]|nr:DUF5615 family PIN-like protein [Phycisphaerales bacterium]
MDFLIDANRPRGTVHRIARMGHSAVDVRDLVLAAADDDTIAAHAQSNDMCLVSRDFDFADVRNYPARHFSGILILHLPNETSVENVLAVLALALGNAELLSTIKGRLAIVDFMRVRIRSGRWPASPASRTKRHSVRKRSGLNNRLRG